MDYQLEYISRYFEKISKKKIETYVVTRIWHLLNDSEVLIVPQQYVKRLESYALTDLYLPQIGFHVEINEPAHYNNIERESLDNLRSEELRRNTTHKVFHIDCRGSLNDINRETDKCIAIIKDEIADKRRANNFKPWQDESEISYHQKRGMLKAEENPSLRTISDICALFDAKVPIRGFLRKGVVNYKDMMIWWPSIGNKNFQNILSEDDNQIIEYSTNEKKRIPHIYAVKSDSRKRVTFFRGTDNLGFTAYKFKGIYELDTESTSIEKGLAWRRIANEISI
jgi:hypothetical protein